MSTNYDGTEDDRAVWVPEPDEADPVELEETSENDTTEPPQEWAAELSDADWDERMEGVVVEEGEEQ